MSARIERLPSMASALPDLFGWIESGLPAFHPMPGLHSIRIEDSVEKGKYTLRAELPGIDPEKDVEITVAHGMLTLRAQRSTKTEERQHSEFRYGTFTRTIQLPPGAYGEEATATYKDGVLTVAIPIPDSDASAKTIPVHAD